MPHTPEQETYRTIRALGSALEEAPSDGASGDTEGTVHGPFTFADAAGNPQRVQPDVLVDSITSNVAVVAALPVAPGSIAALSAALDAAAAWVPVSAGN